MPDWIADPDGCSSADFDLLARMPGLESIDIVCTEARARRRVSRAAAWLVARARRGRRRRLRPRATARPVLAQLSPPASPATPVVHVSRSRRGTDRRRAAHHRRQRRRHALRAVSPSSSSGRCRISISRRGRWAPRDPVADRRSLPLAAEPAAAALDLVLELAETELHRATRSSRCCVAALPVRRDADTCREAISGARSRPQRRAVPRRSELDAARGLRRIRRRRRALRAGARGSRAS